MRKFIFLSLLLSILLFSLGGCKEQQPAVVPEQPYFTAICGSTIMVSGNLYRLEQGEQIQISAIHPSGIASISYRLGDGELITQETRDSIWIDLPAQLSGQGIFSLNVYVTAQDGNESDWAQYLLTTTTVPLLSLYYQEKLLEPDTEYTLEAGAVLTCQAQHPQGVKQINYRLGQQEIESLPGEQGQIVIDPAFLSRGSFSLNVQAEAVDGAVSLWQQYLFVLP